MAHQLFASAVAWVCVVLGFCGTHAVHAQDADKKCVRPRFACGVHEANERGEMHLAGVGLGAAKAAGKVPVVHTFGQGGAALACHVLAHFVFAGVEQAVTVAAFDSELE